MTDTYVHVPRSKIKEGSSFTATAYFRSGNSSATPTAAKYRIDCLTTGKKIKDWTALTPAASVSIAVTATENAIQDQSNKSEKKQITVAADPDTATQTRDIAFWVVENIIGF